MEGRVVGYVAGSEAEHLRKVRLTSEDVSIGCLLLTGRRRRREGGRGEGALALRPSDISLD